MALEPAFALVIGFAALSQVPNGLAVAGIGLVVAAGIGAERSGSRRPGEDAVRLEDRSPVDVVLGGPDELEARGRDQHQLSGRDIQP